MAETWPGLNEEFRGTVVIAGLPADLATVPAGPSAPDDPERFAKRLAWETWAYQIREYRLATLQACQDHPEFRAFERQKCANDPLYLLTMYGYLYEPRKGGGRGGYNPWIPFERQAQQVRWYQWTMQQTDQNADGLESKCRDVGASWTMCLCFLWEWQFSDVFNGLLVSLKAESVDSRKPKALFWKIDQLLRYQPDWLRPRNFDPLRHRIKMYLTNPENGNTIGGETTTTNAGRSDRITAALFDEAAQIPEFMDTWTGTADSTEHRYAISTESMKQGPDFANLRSGADAEYHPAVFTIDWYEHPLHDDAWYQRQEQRYAADPDGFRQEILRDPYSQSQFVYPQARDKFPLPGLMHVPGNPLYVAIDPGKDDNTAIVVIQYNVAEARYEVLNGYTNNKMLAEVYGPILSGSWTMLDGTVIDREEYSPYEQDLIDWMATLTNNGKVLPKYIGDMYGDTNDGASADTWYSVWFRNHGIQVNRDRLPSGKLAAHRMQARTHTGRRKAVRWLLGRLVFGDTIGARQALLALQNNSFPQPGRNGRIPESGMLRDSTTHYTSAIEYWAANMYMQDQLTQYNAQREKRQAAEAAEEQAASSRIRSLGSRRIAEVA